MTIPRFLSSTIDGHVDCFHFGAIGSEMPVSSEWCNRTGECVLLALKDAGSFQKPEMARELIALESPGGMRPCG